MCQQFFTRTSRKSLSTNSVSVMNKTSVIGQEVANFNHGYQMQHDRTLAFTKDMIEKMNEMLKSNRHRNEFNYSYQQILQKNGFGYVYFVKAPNGTTKIGLTTRDPFKRIMEIFGGVNTSYDVKVIHLIRTDLPTETEKEFHRYFSEKRHINKYNPREKSEFFHLNEEDWNWLQRQQYPESIKRLIKQ